jgi:hypothetical protein
LGLKLPQPQRHLNFGTAIHAAIENIYEQLDEKDGWSLAEFAVVKKVFLNYWKLDCISDDDFPTEAERLKCYEEMKADGLNMLEDYWNNKELLLNESDIDIVKSEVVVKTELVNPLTKEILQVPLSCRIDALTRNGKIVEFKTSSSKYDETETALKPQGLAYSFAYLMMNQKLPVGLDYIILLKGRAKNRVQHIKLNHNHSDMLAFFERVKSILQRISNKEFDRPMINHPYFCDCDKFELALKY